MDAAEVLAQLRNDAGLREMARALLLGDELLRLPESFARLEAVVERLAEGQERLEQAVSELTEGLAKLFEGQAKLFEGQAKLFEGQARLEERVEGQGVAIENLEKAVGSLSHTIGGTAEEDASTMLEYVLGRRGFRFLAEPVPVDLDGDDELDVAARVEDSDGRQLSAIVEARVRLRAREVRQWAARLRDPAFRQQLEAAGLAAPYLVYVYGIRIYADAKDAARELGIGVLSSRGEDVSTEPTAA